MNGGKIIKVCGMRDGENIAAVDALGIDMMGFIFYDRSPRCVASLPSAMPRNARRVGVFVNATQSEISSRINQFELDYVQLHGAETPEFCSAISALGVRVIKAFSVSAEFDLKSVEPYVACCELFVFDTKCSGYGGSGEQFDWHLLDGYSSETPFLLSGGVDAGSVPALKAFDHPSLAGYDLNSRFEVAPAIKDVGLLTTFLEQLK